MNRYSKILKLYLCNPIFLVLSAIFFFGAVLSRIGIHYELFSIAEDTMTMLFVFTVWLAFVFGVLIKRQFANHRASLLPGYRGAHSVVVVLVYLVFAATACIWESGTAVNPVLKITSAELAGIYLTCLFMSVLIIYFGYLSIGVVLFLAYFIILMMAGQTQLIIDFLGEFDQTRMILGIATVVLTLFFGFRLMTLKEEMFEYPFLFSWPQKDFVRNQMRASWILSDVFERAALEMKLKKDLPVPPYPRQKSFLNRALHWDHWERQETTTMILLLLIMTPVYMQSIEHPYLHTFYKNPYANFLFYAIAPVLITICGRYKQMAYLGHDLMKPVRRAQYLRERGFVLGQDFMVYWWLFVIYFAIAPNHILHTAALSTGKFWAYLFLTASYGAMTLVWIAYMAALTSPKAVIFNGVLLCVLTQIEFMVAGYLPAGVMLQNALICITGSFFLVQMAYRKWCAVEFR